MKATLERVSGQVWFVIDGYDKVLLTVQGAVADIFEPTLASLVADHGYPPGRWEVNPAGHGYVFVSAED